MNMLGTGTERWGQPPISVYKMYSDGEKLYATELDDYYGELIYFDEGLSNIVSLLEEDRQDIALFRRTLNEPTITWEDLKRELAKDGVL